MVQHTIRTVGVTDEIPQSPSSTKRRRTTDRFTGNGAGHFLAKQFHIDRPGHEERSAEVSLWACLGRV
jgi:hypothetical protein